MVKQVVIAGAAVHGKRDPAKWMANLGVEKGCMIKKTDKFAYEVSGPLSGVDKTVGEIAKHFGKRFVHVSEKNQA